MSGSPGDILKALKARTAALVITPDALPVSYPEPLVTFDPPADGKYLRFNLLPNAHAWQGLSGGHIKQGLLQITVVWPRNKGLDEPKAVVGQVLTHFAMPLVMFFGSAKVKVTGDPVEGPTLYEPTSAQMPITIPWKA